MIEGYSITWRGVPPADYHGPVHCRRVGNGYLQTIDRQAPALGSEPGNWASHFDAWQELRWRLQAMGWRDVRPITRELVKS